MFSSGRRYTESLCANCKTGIWKRYELQASRTDPLRRISYVLTLIKHSIARTICMDAYIPARHNQCVIPGTQDEIRVRRYVPPSDSMTGRIEQFQQPSELPEE